MNSTAFIAGTPVLARATPTFSTSSFAAHCTKTFAPTARRSAMLTMKGSETPKAETPKVAPIPEVPQIPQGFTAFSEQLNGRAAMIGFILALATEAITGKGIIGQVSSIFEVVNRASALSK